MVQFMRRNSDLDFRPNAQKDISDLEAEDVVEIAGQPCLIPNPPVIKHISRPSDSRDKGASQNLVQVEGLGIIDPVVYTQIFHRGGVINIFIDDGSEHEWLCVCTQIFFFLG